MAPTRAAPERVARVAPLTAFEGVRVGAVELPPVAPAPAVAEEVELVEALAALPQTWAILGRILLPEVPMAVRSGTGMARVLSMK